MYRVTNLRAPSRSLPKRGDRVRVTASVAPSPLRVGDTVTLARDALEYGDDGSIHFDFETLPGFAGTTWSGPVKVEILERADEDDGCDNCDAPMVKAAVITEDGAHFCSERCYAQYFPKPVHPDFARGMRRAVEIAERRVGPFTAHDLRELVEEELLKCGR